MDPLGVCGGCVLVSFQGARHFLLTARSAFPEVQIPQHFRMAFVVSERKPVTGPRGGIPESSATTTASRCPAGESGQASSVASLP